MLVEMVVESVRVNLQTYQRVVVLKEKGADRYLPIWIGNNEADAIVIQLQNVPVPRPQTHDLLKAVISQLGAKVSHIVVNDLNDEVFYARINVDLDGRHVEIDSRPSDAIALAVRMQAPIYAEDSVLERAGVALDAESEEVEASSRSGEGQSESSSVDPERLPAAFRDFINTLDLDDLGRGGQGKR
jgi:bifunctional DNase/RNase